MIKKTVVSGFVLIISLVMISAIQKPLSGGAPSASSGAPDEQTCAMTTCHDDNSLNSGTAMLKIEIPEIVNEGENVPVKILISDIGKVRFGFQVTALDDMNKKVGEFILTDSVRTQIIGGSNTLPEREYLTYTYNGTQVQKTGYTEWNGEWKSPLKKGKVTFYVAAVSANNDGEDKGDMVYTTSKNLVVSHTTNTKTIHNLKDIGLSVQGLHLTITNPHYNFINTISIVDMEGKTILNKSVKNADSKMFIELPEMASGIVVVTLHNTTGFTTKKIFINND